MGRCEPPGRPERRPHEEAPARDLMERVKELEQLVGQIEKRFLTLKRIKELSQRNAGAGAVASLRRSAMTEQQGGSEIER